MKQLLKRTSYFRQVETKMKGNLCCEELGKGMFIGGDKEKLTLAMWAIICGFNGLWNS